MFNNQLLCLHLCSFFLADIIRLQSMWFCDGAVSRGGHQGKFKSDDGVTALLKTRQAPSLSPHRRESNSNSGRWIAILFYGHILVAQMKIGTGTHQSSSTLMIRYSTARERPTDGLCDDVNNMSI